ncbi:major facilitator superfamily domain-containing protein [Russula dissimulans]|nr:major facilitator superfamily domain-containing protein [Russula dissimulans]
MGISFAQFMYIKRYCSDPRIVGTRRRTTLAGWLVVCQTTGFTVGPFVGGLLYEVGFGNAVFNGYTSPGWVMAAVWLVFWAIVAVLFEDVPRRDSSARASSRTAAREAAQVSSMPRTGKDMTTKGVTFPLSPLGAMEEQAVTSPSKIEPAPAQGDFLGEDDDDGAAQQQPICARQWAVTATMCWFAMTCFFVLGAWQVNIPVFSAHAFRASPFAAGNLIALGGVCILPFMLMNVMLARRVQDRYILAAGCALGLVGLLVALVIVAAGCATLARLFVAWFFVALGFNLASTVTLSLLSKQMPHSWNGRISLFIQYSTYVGRVCGAVWGGAGVDVGMTRYLGLQLFLLGIGGSMSIILWKEMNAKTG